MQELASHMGFPVDSVKHYGADGDVNRVLLMADLVLYGSFQEEQSFPPLLVRAMSFEIPIIVPNLDIVTKYVSLPAEQLLIPTSSLCRHLCLY